MASVLLNPLFFLLSIILFDLPTSFYHSHLPETLSPLGFENTAPLFSSSSHSALLVLPLLLELSMLAYSEDSIFGLPSISRLSLPLNVSPVPKALKSTHTLTTPNIYVSPILLSKCQTLAYSTPALGSLKDISSITRSKLDFKSPLT